jgi:2-hydroxychromene-2-carboxylate isomerase
VAAELGLDGARLEVAAARPKVGAVLDESRKLARALGVRGTPSYVVGDTVLFGAVGVGALRDRIAVVRQK